MLGANKMTTFARTLFLVISVSAYQPVKSVCKPGERIPNEHDCTMYFSCINGEYIGLRCKKLHLTTQLFFDSVTKTCIDKVTAKCYTSKKS